MKKRSTLNIALQYVLGFFVTVGALLVLVGIQHGEEPLATTGVGLILVFGMLWIPLAIVDQPPNE